MLCTDEWEASSRRGVRKFVNCSDVAKHLAANLGIRLVQKSMGRLALLLAEDIVEALHPRSKAHCLKKQVHNFQLWGQALRLP